MITTADSPAPGLVVHQPRRGFRYSTDPFLLAAWAIEGGRPTRFLDVGTGSGIITLLLARLGIPGVGIDVRPEWIALARRSAADSGLVDLARFEVADVREWAAEPMELALANPPYLPLGRGPLPADPLLAHARHELAGSLDEIVESAARLARRVALVLPVGRQAQARRALAAAGRPTARACVVGDALVLLEGRSGGTEPEAARVAMRVDGSFGDRVRSWYDLLGARLAAVAPSAITR